MTTGLRYFTTADIDRPTFDTHGDRVYSSVVSGVRFSFWSRRRKDILGGQGELLSVDAIGFLPSGTDVERRDRISATGPDGVARTFDVVHVVPGWDDRGVLDHVGVELVSI